MRRFTSLKSAAVKVRHSRSGFTLIELIVALAVSVIVMTSLISIAVLTYKSCSACEKQSGAQNLAVLTLERIQNSVRYKGTVIIYSDPEDIPSSDTDSSIYYDPAENGINIGSNTYLKGAFSAYNCVLTFSNSSSAPNNLLEVEITITDKKGNTLYSTVSSIYLLNGKVSGTSGKAITFF